jgi:inositol transport system substrate-binding protein
MSKIVLDRRQLLGASAMLALSTVSGLGLARAAGKPLTIAVSVPSLSFPWYVHMQKEFQDEATKLGDIKIIILDGENSAPKQTSDVEAAMVQKVDALIIAPIDVNALSPVLQQAIGANIPVVTVDRQAVGVDGILQHVGADNAKGGEVQAKTLMADFPDGAKVFNLQGQPGAGPAIQRNKGLHVGLDPAKDKYKIIFEQTANFARAEALSVTEAGLAAHGAPDAVVAANDDMALGALEALQARGMMTKVKIYGFDALPECLKMIREDKIRATIEQSPGGQCRTALRTAAAFLRDGTKPDQAVKLITPLAVTKANLDKAERISEA